jgi:hypothetical protein
MDIEKGVGVTMLMEAYIPPTAILGLGKQYAMKSSGDDCGFYRTVYMSFYITLG